MFVPVALLRQALPIGSTFANNAQRYLLQDAKGIGVDLHGMLLQGNGGIALQQVVDNYGFTSIRPGLTTLLTAHTFRYEWGGMEWVSQANHPQYWALRLRSGQGVTVYATKSGQQVVKLVEGTRTFMLYPLAFPESPQRLVETALTLHKTIYKPEPNASVIIPQFALRQAREAQWLHGLTWGSQKIANSFGVVDLELIAWEGTLRAPLSSSQPLLGQDGLAMACFESQGLSYVAWVNQKNWRAAY